MNSLHGTPITVSNYIPDGKALLIGKTRPGERGLWDYSPLGESMCIGTIDLEEGTMHIRKGGFVTEVRASDSGYKVLINWLDKAGVKHG